MSASGPESWEYDGSPAGLCALVACAWKRQSAPERLEGPGRQSFDLSFFSPDRRREWGYLPRRLESLALRIWMSESPLELPLLRLAARAGISGPDALADWSDPDFRVIASTVRSVSREEHRLKGFARFSEQPDLGLVAVLSPDFDVLPALVPWFEARLGREAFALADRRRGYAIACPADRTQGRRLIASASDNTQAPGTPATGSLATVASAGGHVAPDPHADLWKRYFSAAENPLRANPTLQRRLVPQRYRANMTEFDGQAEGSLL